MVYLASRRALYTRQAELNDVRLAVYPEVPSFNVSARPRIVLDTESVTRRVGLDRSQLADLEEGAISCGYFDSCPVLATVDVPSNKINKVAKRLEAFRGQGNWSVTPGSVRAFLAQFPPALRDPMVKLLENITIFDRKRLASDIGRTIRGIALGNSNGCIVGLSPDSGNIVRVQLEHDLKNILRDTGWKFAKTIRDALEQLAAGDHLVLCDDNVTSGSQAICQFKSWLDIPKTPEEERERGIELAALSPRDRDALRAVNVAIVTSAGTPSGAKRLQTQLGTFGLKFGGLMYATQLNNAAANLGPLETYLRRVGTQVLAWFRHRADSLDNLSSAQRRACTRDALGYRGARAVACTPMNVPVGTLAALWCPGVVDGKAWTPLLIRRGYLNSLVLS